MRALTKKLNKFSVEQDESGGYTVKKKGMFGAKSLSIGPKGVGMKKSSLLSNQSVSLGPGGIDASKSGLLSEKAAHVGAGGADYEKSTLLTHTEVSVGSGGVNYEKDGLLSKKAAHAGADGASYEKSTLLTHKETDVPNVFNIVPSESRPLTEGSPWNGEQQKVNPATLVTKMIVVQGKGTAKVISFNKVSRMDAIMMKNSTHTIQFSDSGRKEDVLLSRYKQSQLNVGVLWYFLFADEQPQPRPSTSKRMSSSIAK